MELFQIISLVAGGIALLLFIVLMFVNHKYSKLLKALSKREVDNIRIKNGVRYTVDQTIFDEEGDVNVSLSQKDLLLEMNKTEFVGAKNRIKPGKYTLLSTRDKEETFNIRMGNYVNEFHHAQSIVLVEGQEITAVNCSVILR